MKKLLAALVLFFAPVGAAAAQELQPLKIESGDAVHEFQVELADEEDERSLGLMHREELGRDRGMLFTYDRPQQAGVWMKNTLISLDMLFVASDGTVVSIAKNAVPGSLRTIQSGFPVKAFLEINGGQADELGIKPGDVVRHEALGNWTTEEN